MRVGNVTIVIFQICSLGDDQNRLWALQTFS